MPTECSPDFLERTEAAIAQLEALALVSTTFRINTSTGEPEYKVASTGNWHRAFAYNDGGNIVLTLDQTPSA